jgi:hypothetical protein
MNAKQKRAYKRRRLKSIERTINALERIRTDRWADRLEAWKRGLTPPSEDNRSLDYKLEKLVYKRTVLEIELEEANKCLII